MEPTSKILAFLILCNTNLSYLMVSGKPFPCDDRTLDLARLHNGSGLPNDRSVMFMTVSGLPTRKCGHTKTCPTAEL